MSLAVWLGGAAALGAPAAAAARRPQPWRGNAHRIGSLYESASIRPLRTGFRISQQVYSPLREFWSSTHSNRLRRATHPLLLRRSARTQAGLPLARTASPYSTCRLFPCEASPAWIRPPPTTPTYRTYPRLTKSSPEIPREKYPKLG